MRGAAISLHFSDPEHGVHGSARGGATLLFEGERSKVLPVGASVEASGGGWRAVLEDAFSLRFEPVAPAADLDGVEAHVCAVRGSVGTLEVDCLGTVAETRTPPAWDELDALRSISALFAPDSAFLTIARRPRGALGHGDERIAAWLLRDGVPTTVEDARISTVYDGDGRQRSAGLELWVAGEELPLRASGTVVAGSSLQLEGVDVHAAVFRWQMGDREGSGSYELMARSEPQAA